MKIQQLTFHKNPQETLPTETWGRSGREHEQPWFLLLLFAVLYRVFESANAFD